MDKYEGRYVAILGATVVAHGKDAKRACEIAKEIGRIPPYGRQNEKHTPTILEDREIPNSPRTRYGTPRQSD